MHSKKLFTSITAVLLIMGILGLNSVAYAKTNWKKIKVTSTAFQNNGQIPVKYALSPEIPGGENISIPLQWKVKKKAAKKIKSFAISMVDLHPVANKCVHMLLINISPAARELTEGAITGYSSLPEGTQQLMTCLGTLGYGGPAPPPGGGDHIYETTIYGLKIADLGIGMDQAMDKQYTADEFANLVKGKVVAKGKLHGKFNCPGTTPNC